jgi:non-haem Fe2+, alpha-ketoglutarate-dependent halogenase
MRVVPQSHLEGLLPHAATFARNNMLTRGQEVQFDFKQEETVPIILRPGEMSLHHLRIIHGSLPNYSHKKRVGFVIRYIAPSVKQIEQRPKAILARGCDMHNNFEMVEPPCECLMEESIIEHQKLAREFLEQVALSSSYRQQSQ